MVGLGLIAVFAMAAMASSPAMAETCKKGEHLYGGTCETEREHAQFQAFANCPFEAAPFGEEGYQGVQGCVWAESSAKEKFRNKAEQEALEAEGRVDLPSQFTAGNVTVKLKMPIVLKGGFEEKIAGGEEGKYQWIGAEGADTIQPVAQPAPPLSKDVDTSKLSASELERYNYVVHISKQTKTTATVELAGPATALILNEENLLLETGIAFGFPVKVKLSNPFVGNNCYVGSDEHPIMVEFTTGTAGALKGKRGTLTTSNQGAILDVSNDTLVSSGFSTPGVEGCGVEGGADEAINSALGLPATEGTAVIDGAFKQASHDVAKEGLEGTL